MASFDTLNQELELALADVASFESQPLFIKNGVDTNKPHNNNPFVKLNVLPVEILSFIFLLIGPPSTANPYPYLHLTWVCRYWRSLLIHNPIFWTNIKLPDRNAQLTLHPFVQEIILRSKAMELDLIISEWLSRFSTTITIEAFLMSESNRIRNLWLGQTEFYIDQLTFSNKTFSSLRQLIYDIRTTESIESLLQILATSENLDVFQCRLLEDVTEAVKQLAPTFCRVRKLVLQIPSPHTDFARSIIASLNDSPKIQNLSLKFDNDYLGEIMDRVPIILPELLILWSNCLSAIEQIRAPRLSLLDIIVFDAPMLDHEHTIFEDFDFSSTKYLYVRRCYEGYCISGSKYFSSCKVFAQRHMSEGFQDVFPHNHNWPRDCFHTRLNVVEGHSLSKRLQDVLLAIGPRLTNLTSLYLTIPDSLYDLEQLLKAFPLIENLIIDDGDNAMNFIDLLHDTSLCRCLKELSYTTYWIPKNIDTYAENVGRELTECLQSRKKDDAHQLKSIYMDNCPPLSKTWLEELQTLDTVVITAKDLQSVKRRTQLLTTDQ